MIKQWLFILKSFSRQLLVRATFFGLLAVASSLVAVLFKDYVPDKFADLAGGKAVDGILTMMASSMLIVVTFALSNMVAAYSSATQHAIPRATRLIKDDSNTHSAISIFLGAFIYSVVSLIALSTDYYGEKGRVILLLLTIIVLASVVWVIIKWVNELKNMVSVSETIARVERAVTKALEERSLNPTFGCNRLDALPENLISVKSNKIGFIQNIDVDFLGKLSEKERIEFYVGVDVGDFVHLQTTLISVKGREIPDKLSKKIEEAFYIESNRTFDSDPLYGFSVLSGIGIKAMSPSLNDPGTAMDVVWSLVRVISRWECQKAQQIINEPKFKRVFFPELRVQDIFHEAFYNLTGQSISSLQVTESLKEALMILQDLSDSEFKSNAKVQIDLLDSRARQEFILASDLKRLNIDPYQNKGFVSK